MAETTNRMVGLLINRKADNYINEGIVQLCELDTAEPNEEKLEELAAQFEDLVG